MFNAPFNVVQLTSHTVVDEWHSKEHIWSFKTSIGRRYLVVLNEYDHYIFGVKFFPTSHKSAKNKVHVQTGEFQASRIIASALEVMLRVADKYPLASFAVVGTQSIGREGDSRRFRIYSRLIENKFTPIQYEHYDWPDNRLYLLLNKDYIEIEDSTSARYVLEYAHRLMGHIRTTYIV